MRVSELIWFSCLGTPLYIRDDGRRVGCELLGGKLPRRLSLSSFITSILPEIRPSSLRLDTKSRSYLLRAAIQASHILLLLGVQHPRVAPPLLQQPEEREEGRRLRELLLLVYDKKGHGRDPEHDRGELHQVLSGVSLPSFHGSWGKGERDSIGSIAILTFGFPVRLSLIASLWRDTCI